MNQRNGKKVALNAAALQDHFSRSLRLDTELRKKRSARKQQQQQLDIRVEEEQQHEGSFPPWTCERCTMFNVDGSKRCEACGSLRKFPLEDMERNGQETLAQRLNLVPRAPIKLSDYEWKVLENESEQRKDSLAPCAICQENFKMREQVLLSCSHVFHQQCLESFERFVRTRERFCPLCRKQNYEKRKVELGKKAMFQQSIVRIQTFWRCHRIRIQFENRLAEFYANGQGNEIFRRKFFAKQLQKVTTKLDQHLSKEDDALDRLFAEFDENLKDSRRIFANDFANIDWESIFRVFRERGDSEECPICMYELDPASTTVLSCSHGFHTNCINAFEQFSIDKAPSCPMCREIYLGRRELSD